MVTRLHARLFEDAARDLDRQIRAQYLGEGLRPAYLKEFEKHLDAASQKAADGVETGGRMLWAKKAFRRLMRPYLAHQEGLNRLLIERIAALHENLGRLSAGLDGLRDELSDDLARQGDTLRAEIARRARFRPEGDAAATAADPVAPGSRLLLGEVVIGMPGYLHINPSGRGGADRAAAYDRLPVAPGTADEIVAVNVLELFPAEEVGDRLLPYWAALLRPGGKLTVIGDDAGAAAERFRDGQIGLDELTALLFGVGGETRRSAFAPGQLREVVAGAGFAGVAVTERRERPASGAYGFELVAYRPAG